MPKPAGCWLLAAFHMTAVTVVEWGWQSDDNLMTSSHEITRRLGAYQLLAGTRAFVDFDPKEGLRLSPPRNPLCFRLSPLL